MDKSSFVLLLEIHNLEASAISNRKPTHIMKNIKSILVFLSIVPLGMESLALEPIMKVIPQEDAPIEISYYDADYVSGEGDSRQGVRHAVSVRNLSDQEVVAFEVGLFSFNVFNDFLDRSSGVSMSKISPGRLVRETWMSDSPADFSFLTGVAFISRVRFSDGTIWSEEFRFILDTLQDLELNFKAEEITGANP